MSFGEIISAAEATPTHLRVCAPEEITDLAERFGVRNVTVEHVALPAGSGEGFVIVTRGDEFVGSVGLGAVETLATPPTPGVGEPRNEEFQLLVDLLDDTVFTSLDRRQMLATSREIEDRAWRLERGTLYAGFQSFSAMEAQVSIYERLASKPELDVHVFGEPDWEPSGMEGVTLHPSDDPEITRVWFVVYEGDDRLDRCALLAEEREPGRFHGFWTYDPDCVRGIVSQIEAAVAADGT